MHWDDTRVHACLHFLMQLYFGCIVEKTTLASSGLKSPLMLALKCPFAGINNVR